ncbi:hypothetical protein [Amycolatopsis sp. NPDC051903]|uniref:hypothetical protein n=1 Tax=Amycolatopsis sp. NPDC051903 TaxID=3363936 RepID=UPI0037BE0F76
MAAGEAAASGRRRVLSGPAWNSYVVVDGNLVTGQNPASGRAAAEAFLKELAHRAR